jgi:L-iduronidase
LLSSEADPISGWSHPRDFQSDVRYAVILVETVFQHWNLIYRNETPNLRSISHDNAFLSYHPHEFDQRTLLARFKMNLTRPPHVQFIQKPVYAALGMLANLGELASGTFEVCQELICLSLSIFLVHSLKIPNQNLTYLITRNAENASLYICIIAVYNRDCSNKTFRHSLEISHLNISTSTSKYFVESLQTNATDPVSVWRAAGSPAYPNGKLRRKMRLAQVF